MIPKFTFKFFPGRDSAGNDVCDRPFADLTVRELKQKCIELGAAGFNSNGWIKSAVLERKEWNFLPTKTKGLYIKTVLRKRQRSNSKESETGVAVTKSQKKKATKSQTKQAPTDRKRSRTTKADEGEEEGGSEKTPKRKKKKKSLKSRKNSPKSTEAEAEAEAEQPTATAPSVQQKRQLQQPSKAQLWTEDQVQRFIESPTSTPTPTPTSTSTSLSSAEDDFPSVIYPPKNEWIYSFLKFAFSLPVEEKVIFERLKSLFPDCSATNEVFQRKCRSVYKKGKKFTRKIKREFLSGTMDFAPKRPRQVEDQDVIVIDDETVSPEKSSLPTPKKNKKQRKVTSLKQTTSGHSTNKTNKTSRSRRGLPPPFNSKNTGLKAGGKKHSTQRQKKPRKHASTRATNPATKPASKILSKKPLSKAVSKPLSKAVSRAASKPVSRAVSKPLLKPAPKVVSKPAPKAVSKSTLKPMLIEKSPMSVEDYQQMLSPGPNRMAVPSVAHSKPPRPAFSSSPVRLKPIRLAKPISTMSLEEYEKQNSKTS